MNRLISRCVLALSASAILSTHVMAADAASCQNVRMGVVNWTDVIATSAITHGNDLPLPSPSRVVAIRSAAPDSAISAPSIEPRAMMIPASPRIAPAPLLNALATSSGGSPAPTPAINVPIRIDRNGGNLVALISTMMLAIANSTQSMRRVS